MNWPVLCNHYAVLWQEGMGELRLHRQEHRCKKNKCENERQLMARNAAHRWLARVYSALSERRA